MVKCGKTLPDHYVLHETIDLRKNKKQFWTVNGINLLLAALCVLGGWFIVDPIAALNGVSEDSFWLGKFLPLSVTIVGMIAYIILHELTHGVFLGAFTGMKPKFGFIGWAAYCGNEGYCTKGKYLVVALAPLVVWGIVFSVLTVFFHDNLWFWCIWALQTLNVSGAAGDLFVSYKIARCKREVLVQDTGMQMKVFRPRTEEEFALLDGSEEKTEEKPEDKTTEETND